MSGERKTIRWAPNPYALAEVALGQSLEWRALEQDRQADKWLIEALLPGAAHDLDALMRGATEAEPVPSVLRLFDRVKAAAGPFDSVEAALAQAVTELGAPAQRVIDAFARQPETLRALQRLVNWLVPIRGAGVGSDERPLGAPPPPPISVEWRDDPAAPLQAGGPRHVDFRDPMQGAAFDCYLLAAMIAIAWTRPDYWEQRVTQQLGGGASNLECTFWSLQPPRLPAEVSVSALLPFKGNQRLYAYSRDGRETWPTLYEKAYVEWKVARAADGEPTADHYRQIGLGFPDHACVELVGIDCGVAFTDMLPALLSRCAPARPVAGGESRASRVPMTAWTYGGEDGARYQAARSQFTIESQLAAGHAYALLGWHRRASDGAEFVILRNPWGSNPSRASYLQGSWATGRTDVPALAEIALNADGVFGIPADLFTLCFNAVTWQG
jgi:hypothetical protein